MSGSSVVSFEKPVPHIDFADWISALQELQSSSDAKIQFAFKLRHAATQLRIETKVKTEWNTYHNDNRLRDRVFEVMLWRDKFQDLLECVTKELEALKAEKLSTDKELGALDIFMQVTATSISNRDSRQSSELTHDLANDELKKELCVEEAIKKMLTGYCQNAYEKICQLEKLKYRLEAEVENKTRTVFLDNDQLSLTKDDAQISFKPDPMRVPKNSISLDQWTENQFKFLAENEGELRQALGGREQLFLARGRAKNTMKAQVDATEYALRRRIYETKRSHGELKWQKDKMEDNMAKLMMEMAKLQASILSKTNTLKLAQTRLENRGYRPSAELAMDEPDRWIKDEVRDLMKILRTLNDKYDLAKATYNNLESQCLRIGADLFEKANTLDIDLKAMRARDGARETILESQADRSIGLVNFQGRIAPT